MTPDDIGYVDIKWVSLGNNTLDFLSTSWFCALGKKLLTIFCFLIDFSCVGVEEDEAPDIDIYHCPNCEKTHGKSTCK